MSKYAAQNWELYLIGTMNLGRRPHGPACYLLDQRLSAGGGEREPGKLAGALIDFPARRSLEEQLAQARRMEAMGQLTSGVAHDFNNLLTVIFGNLDLLARNVPHGDKQAQHVAAIRKAAERGRCLIGQLLAFSRGRRLSPVTLYLNDLVCDIVPLMEHAVGGAVRIEQRLSVERPRTHVDVAQLENALLNLAVNARDAMPEGGVLTLTTAVVERPAGVDALDSHDRRWVRIEVIDNGSGMPREVMERVFEPFFTTKEAGKGSGLGLSQVYGFIRQSGGHVAIESAVGEGTAVRLYLCASEAPISESASAPQAQAQTSGGPSDGRPSRTSRRAGVLR